MNRYDLTKLHMYALTPFEKFFKERYKKSYLLVFLGVAFEQLKPAIIKIQTTDSMLGPLDCCCL